MRIYKAYIPYIQITQKFHYDSLGHQEVAHGMRLDLRQWLASQCPGGSVYYGNGNKPPKDGYTYELLKDDRVCFYFASKSVAVLFKLTWYGVPSILKEPSVPRPTQY